jgi:hypothetical protein
MEDGMALTRRSALCGAAIGLVSGESAPSTLPPCSTGFVRRWRAIFARALTRAVERAKAWRQRALDQRLLARFDDCKLWDIGIDPRTAETDRTMTSWRSGGRP